MARNAKPETNLTEAAEKATALLQGLQSRLSREASPNPTTDTPRSEAPQNRGESPEELDRQLQEYFGASDKGMLDQIRDRVIDAAADRILERWERGNRRELGALEKQVIDRVAERILERMTRR